MSKTVTIYPNKIEQPNQNQSSGLQGKCFKEVRRNKGVYDVNCEYQQDPKYHHAWSNVSNLKEGKTAQCGRKSSYHCNHKTYYSIKGYRNTCPIAGVSGTYTQPATLRLYFDPKSKKIVSTDKIKSVKLIIKHRCSGVDVENDSEHYNWGPNFSGFDTYPNREVLTVKFAGKTKTYNKNPPLSKNNFDTVTMTFDDVKYSHLSEGHLDIIYGNNLSTNPGNIYIKDVKIQVTYESGKKYIEGKQSNSYLYTSKNEACASPLTFKLEVGYKSGSKKISANNAPQVLQKRHVTWTSSEDKNKIIISEPVYSSDKKTISFTVKDISGNVDSDSIVHEELEKSITFELKSVNLKKTFKYTSILRSLPEISLPTLIRKNSVYDEGDGIIAENGCAASLVAYADSVTGSSYTFSTLDNSNQDNIIPLTEQTKFHNWLSSLSCGFHTIFFRRNGELDEEMAQESVRIVSNEYTVKITDSNDQDREIKTITLSQDKESNYDIKLIFEATDELRTDPKFSVSNPTFGKLDSSTEEPTSNKMDDQEWTPSKTGGSLDIQIGTYYSGHYQIKISDIDNCLPHERVLDVYVKPTHKQHFDEIFVRGEDSTAFNYDYLVAMEGDIVLEPIYVNTLTIGSSYKTLKLCAPMNNVVGLGTIETIPLSIKNTSQTNDIENLLLELNVLTENQNGDYEVSTDEWIEKDGMFYNFPEKFKAYNEEGINNIVSVQNLSPDEDAIDEEDVYLKINKIKAGETLVLNIPYDCYMEKESIMQILFSGEPLKIYNSLDCTDETNTSPYIPFKVYDSTLVDLDISGDLDLYVPNDVTCPLECFKSEITYKIRNIDTQSMKVIPETIITKDERLIPQKVRYQGTEYNLNELPSSITYLNDTFAKEFIIGGLKVTNTITFPGNSPKVLSGVTDSSGYITFFVTVPRSAGRSYTSSQLQSISSVKVDDFKFDLKVNFIDNHIDYLPGQTIPFKIKVTGLKNVKRDEFIFYPKILYPISHDEVTIIYKVCNLPKNRGILKTTFKTNSYEVTQNEISKDILFGVKTNTQKSTYSLSKVIVQQNNYNRLYIKLVNEDRFNKDIKVKIEENESIKYSYAYSEAEVGEVKTITVDDKPVIVWEIPYLDADTSVYAYIDLKGDNIGLSDLSITIEDFLTTQNINFETYQCPCRGGTE